jgi:hypothetical protein
MKKTAIATGEPAALDHLRATYVGRFGDGEHREFLCGESPARDQYTA